MYPETHCFEQAGATASFDGQERAHEGKKYGWHHSVFPYPSPLTTPVETQYLQAWMGYPPPHPFPQVPQQVKMLSMEILVLTVWLAAMQTLSVMASAAPKAQHDPQLA